MRSAPELQSGLQDKGRSDSQRVDIRIPALVQPRWSINETLNQEAIRLRSMAQQFRGDPVRNRPGVAFAWLALGRVLYKLGVASDFDIDHDREFRVLKLTRTSRGRFSW